MSPRSSEQFKELRDASRQKILESSLELFGTKGYKSTTISDIVKKAGISKGLIYHYFDSKEDILKQLVDFFIEGGQEKVSELMTGSAKDRLNKIIDWFFREMREHEHQWALFINLTVQVHDFDFIHEMATQKANGYVAMFTELFRELGYENPTAEARILGALFDGIGMQYYVFNEQDYLTEMEQTLRDKYHLL
ncbi:MAG: TetR/AcrR family transcriptional regulator [Cytophagales bacterium]|nr:TetR/AcrR family transcriptional regulator [Cytophagales bacterium]